MFLTPLRAFLRLSSVRQALGLMAVFALFSTLAWGGTYWLVYREMMNAVDTRLAEQMQQAVAALEAGEDLPMALPGQSIALQDSAGPEGFFTYDPEGGDAPALRILRRQSAYGQIVLREDVERQEELRDILSGGMITSLLGTLLATALAALWVGRRGQNRLDQISDGLAKVAQGHLDTRIALEGRRDDLSLLADRINATTARLDQAMTQMRVQSSNIAHDLRTPLARLRAGIEGNLIALSETGRPVSLDDLGAALEQIDHITGTFNALLRLARLESGAARAGFTNVDLAQLAEHVTETFGPVIEDAGQSLQLELQDPAKIHGDHALLVQLVGNLIQNALRYGPAGQQITLRIFGGQLSISDQGPGIGFEEREKVLEPLYQSQSTRQGAGFGLGLAMVRAIAELHDASLSLGDGPQGQGLRVTVRFPKMTEL